MRIDQAVTNQKAKAKDWGFGKSAKKGTPCFWMDFVFQEIEDDNGGELTIRKDWWITDNTIDYILRDLSVFGYQGRDITEWERNQANSFDFSKAVVNLTTEIEEYLADNGDMKKIAKVKYVNAEFEQLDSGTVKDLNAKLRGKIAAYRAKAGTSSPAKAPDTKAPTKAAPAKKEAVAAGTPREPLFTEAEEKIPF